MTAQRSIRANIAWAMASKVISMAVAVLSVPILLRLLGTESYGTWVTLTSLIAFVSLLDLGVGNSVRNSVAAVDAGRQEAVRTEFIGFFQMLCGVALLSLFTFGLSLRFSSLMSENRVAALWLYAPLLLMLPMLLGASVLQGARATGLQATLQAASGWSFFTWVALLAWTARSPSLTDLALAWSVFYAATLIATFILALRVLHIPARQLFRWSFMSLPKGRLKVGIEFLALQLSSLVLYSLGNTLIYAHLGAEEVARYDVLNKIFQVALGFYTIVIGIMWSEIARQRADSDAAALRRTYRRLALIASVFSGIALVAASAAPWVIDRWTQQRLHVSFLEALAVAGLVSIQSLAYVGAVFMNAFEQIRIQVILAGASIVLMVPLSSTLMTHGLGIASVPLAAAMLTLVPVFVCNLHAIRLVRKVHSGVVGSP